MHAACCRVSTTCVDRGDCQLNPQGLCGCLSTISTFAVEIRTLSRRNAYRYVLVSWAVGQTLVLLVYGVPAFSLDLSPTCALR